MDMKTGMKALVIAMALMIVSGCSFGKDEKNPVLEHPAFDIIGDQGIKDSMTLSELQGEYSGKLWFEEHEKSLYSSESYSCTGRIDGSILTVIWEMDGKSFGLGEGMEFGETLSLEHKLEYSVWREVVSGFEQSHESDGSEYY